MKFRRNLRRRTRRAFNRFLLAPALHSVLEVGDVELAGVAEINEAIDEVVVEEEVSGNGESMLADTSADLTMPMATQGSGNVYLFDGNSKGNFEIDRLDQRERIVHKLRNLYMDTKISQKAMSGILKILREEHINVPVDPRTVIGCSSKKLKQQIVSNGM